MRCRKAEGRRFSATILLSAGLLSLSSLAADAHVKWFSTYNVAGSPRSLLEVCSVPFFQLVAVAAVALWIGCHVERTQFGRIILAAIDRLSNALKARTEDMFRACTGAFFIALWATGNIILTPELTTQSPVIPWIQAAIAVGMFWRPTMVLSAIGIAFLFAIGVANYGSFHMMDYPIFLGIAIYLGLIGLRPRFGRILGNVRPLDIARWGAGITLMWASVEKFAYPQWTYPLLQQHSDLALGLDKTFYLTAAGVVEFSLAFALVWTPLVRRVAAILLAAMFTSAVLEFGKIDAIGHLMIVVILVAVAADDAPAAERRPVLVPAYFCAALVAFVAVYYVAHAMIFGTTII
jgi:hypothetical protein